MRYSRTCSDLGYVTVSADSPLGPIRAAGNRDFLIDALWQSVATSRCHVLVLDIRRPVCR
jgi:hypothetical protein